MFSDLPPPISARTCTWDPRLVFVRFCLQNIAYSNVSCIAYMLLFMPLVDIIRCLVGVFRCFVDLDFFVRELLAISNVIQN